MKPLATISRCLTSSLSLCVALLLLMLSSMNIGHAQTRIPIEIGETVEGEFMLDANVPSYVILSDETHVITIEVQALSENFYPQLSISFPDQDFSVPIINTYRSSRISTNTTINAGGEIYVGVMGKDRSPGSFSLSVNIYEPDTITQELMPNTTVEGEPSSYKIEHWVFWTEPDQIYGILLEEENNQNRRLEVRDMDRMMIVSGGADVFNGELWIRPNASDYIIVSVRNDLLSALPSATYKLSLLSEPNPIENEQTQGNCVLATLALDHPNDVQEADVIRAGAGEDFDIVGQMPAYLIYTVIGQDEEENWYQIQAGWVAAENVRLGGDCSDVAVKSGRELLPAPTPTPTRQAVNGGQ